MAQHQNSEGPSPLFRIHRIRISKMEQTLQFKSTFQNGYTGIHILVTPRNLWTDELCPFSEIYFYGCTHPELNMICAWWLTHSRVKKERQREAKEQKWLNLQLCYRTFPGVMYLVHLVYLAGALIQSDLVSTVAKSNTVHFGDHCSSIWNHFFQHRWGKNRVIEFGVREANTHWCQVNQQYSPNV